MTMMHTITITLDAQAASLQRLLGVIRRRGFDVLRLDVARTRNDGEFQGRLRLRGARSIDALIRHVTNIEEVQQVTLIPAASIQAA